MDINARIAGIVERRTGELVALRRELHQHPELAFEEHETAKAVSAFLTRLGIKHRVKGTFVSVEVRNQNFNFAFRI